MRPRQRIQQNCFSIPTRHVTFLTDVSLFENRLFNVKGNSQDQIGELHGFPAGFILFFCHSKKSDLRLLHQNPKQSLWSTWKNTCRLTLKQGCWKAKLGVLGKLPLKQYNLLMKVNCEMHIDQTDPIVFFQVKYGPQNLRVMFVRSQAGIQATANLNCQIDLRHVFQMP